MSTSTVSDGSLDEGTFVVEDMSAIIEDYFFEGAEKLLEIWFDKEQDGVTSLRNIPHSELVAMLDIAHCHILHSRSDGCMDSYVLRMIHCSMEARYFAQKNFHKLYFQNVSTESSMFISDFRIILKTCGTTRLLHTIGRMLQLAKTYCNMDNVTSVFYSRKNFLHPEKQPYPHSSFEAEVAFLENYFTGGAAYYMGPVNQEGRWFLYTLASPKAALPNPYHTLEILMTELPEDILGVFNNNVCKNGKDCRMKSGLSTILEPGTIVHEELFNPCGYSMNGIFPHTDQYVTVHVTPEPDFSYVSFETNRITVLFEQILKVIEIFRPNKFLLTVFTNELSSEGKDVQKKMWDRKDIFDYRQTNLQFLFLEGEKLAYAQYERSSNVEQLIVGKKGCSAIDNDNDK